MTESEISALLDAHDALVRACVDDHLEFTEFLAAYGDFPGAYGLDEHTASAEERAVLRLFRTRIAFHERVAGVISAIRSDGDSGTLYGDVGRFVPKVGLMMLRELCRFQHSMSNPSAIDVQFPVCSAIHVISQTWIHRERRYSNGQFAWRSANH